MSNLYRAIALFCPKRANRRLYFTLPPFPSRWDKENRLFLGMRYAAVRIYKEQRPCLDSIRAVYFPDLDKAILSLDCRFALRTISGSYSIYTRILDTQRVISILSYVCNPREIVDVDPA